MAVNPTALRKNVRTDTHTQPEWSLKATDSQAWIICLTATESVIIDLWVSTKASAILVGMHLITACTFI